MEDRGLKIGIFKHQRQGSRRGGLEVLEDLKHRGVLEDLKHRGKIAKIATKSEGGEIKLTESITNQ